MVNRFDLLSSEGKKKQPNRWLLTNEINESTFQSAVGRFLYTSRDQDESSLDTWLMLSERSEREGIYPVHESRKIRWILDVGRSFRGIWLTFFYSPYCCQLLSLYMLQLDASRGIAIGWRSWVDEKRHVVITGVYTSVNVSSVSLATHSNASTSG